MSRATDLIVECKAALADVEKAIVEFEKDAESEIGHFTDLAQLSIAAHRLGILRDSLHRQMEDRVAEPGDDAEPAEPASEDGDGLDALMRKDLNAKAQELGIEAPAKLGNKDAVIAAIREALAEESESENGDAAEPGSEDGEEE